MKSLFRVTIALVLVAFVAGIVPCQARAEDPGHAPVAGEAALRQAPQGEAPSKVLDEGLRNELRARSAQYRGDYAGSGGKSSNVTIHWPTVLLIVILIILL